MLYKSRTKPTELTILELLKKQMGLSDKDKQHYYSLKKGYEGELAFDSLTEKLQCECLILNDLLLEVNNTIFQIDTLIILQNNIYLYEVKNYEGDYFYESDKLFKKPRFEVVNPLHQLSRSQSLLRQLLLNLGFSLPIHASVVFINPAFTLYQAPLDKPIIFPTQVTNYLKNLNATTSKLTNHHKKLAAQLVSLHLVESPYKKIPNYEYAQLKKGITCAKCNSFSISVMKAKCICENCQHEERITDAVLRSVKEFKILFPNEKITTNRIHDWCQIIPLRRVRNTLLDNFKKIGNHRWSYFE